MVNVQVIYRPSSNDSCFFGRVRVFIVVFVQCDPSFAFPILVSICAFGFVEFAVRRGTFFHVGDVMSRSDVLK